MTILSRIAALTNYVEVAQHAGLNPYSLMSHYGLSPSLLENPDNRVSAQAMVDLLEESSRLSGWQDFGLRMAESRQLSDFGAMSLLLTHQRTLREALDVILQYRHMLNEALALYIEEVGKVVIIREEVITDTAVHSRQATELAIGVMFRLCSALLNAHWNPRSVNFTHEAPPETATHRRVFGCKVEFSSEFNGIVFAASDLDVPNPFSDPVMANHARRYVDSLQTDREHSTLFDVKRSIYLLLPMGRASAEQIAQAMGINVRTLQRRLEEANQTYRDVLDSVRADLVQRYMENKTYTISRISDLLGYSTPSSFTRWFTTRFGQAPAQWRKQIRQGDGEHDAGPDDTAS